MNGFTPEEIVIIRVLVEKEFPNWEWKKDIMRKCLTATQEEMNSYENLDWYFLPNPLRELPFEARKAYAKRWLEIYEIFKGLKEKL